MLAIVNSWIQLNRDARKVCKEACDRLSRIEKRDPIMNLCAAFLTKGIEHGDFIAKDIEFNDKFHLGFKVRGQSLRAYPVLFSSLKDDFQKEIDKQEEK